ncbi:hypothetical protein [Candidatus Vidania fulgoroideorum]
MNLSLEIFPNFSYKKILYFLFKIKKNIKFLSIPFNKKTNFFNLSKSFFFISKINIKVLVHYHYNISILNLIKHINIFKNNNINNFLILNGDFNYLKKKNNNLFFFFKKKNSLIYSTFYTNLNKSSLNYSKEISICLKKIKKKIIIFSQQSFCLISFLFFFEFIKKKKNSILGFFIFPNFNFFKNLTFNCNIYLNNWNVFCFFNNFLKKYCLFLYLFIKILKFKNFNNIHFYTLNKFNISYNYFNKIYEKNSFTWPKRISRKNFYSKI